MFRVASRARGQVKSFRSFITEAHSELICRSSATNRDNYRVLPRPMELRVGFPLRMQIPLLVAVLYFAFDANASKWRVLSLLELKYRARESSRIKLGDQSKYKCYDRMNDNLIFLAIGKLTENKRVNEDKEKSAESSKRYAKLQVDR